MRRTVVSVAIATAVALVVAAPASAGLISKVLGTYPANTTIVLENSPLALACPSVPGQPAGTTLNTCGVAPLPGVSAECSHLLAGFPFTLQDLCRVQAAGALLECSETYTNPPSGLGSAYVHTFRCRALAGTVNVDLSCTEEMAGYHAYYQRFGCQVWPIAYEDRSDYGDFSPARVETTRLSVGAVVLECTGDEGLPIRSCRIV